MTPAVTVVVPTHGRPAQLAACLAALAACEPPRGGCEVLVVDDGGDGREARAAASPLDGLDVRVLDRPHGGVSAARNAGAAAARGRLLAFTDDDCLPEPGWLTGLERAWEADAGVLLGGPVVNAFPANPWAEASQAIVELVDGHYNGPAPTFFQGNNIALDAAAHTRLGGFDERLRFAEDRDLAARARAAGLAFAYVPDARVRHAKPLDARGFVAQFVGYGRGAFHFHRRHPSERRTTAAFYRGLPRRLRGTPPRQLALLGVWQAANVAGFAWEAGRAALGRDDA